MNCVKRETTAPLFGKWEHAAVVSESNFKFKSLCEWVVNTTVGCRHGCRFCYVPDVSVNKQELKLNQKGVSEPDSQWGDYVFVREWNEQKFLASLAKAEAKARDQLKPEGHRAIMLSSTCDPYQVFPGYQEHQKMIRRILELIRDESTVNVRVLTRGPLAEKDFPLFRSFGNRLLFGMSLPSLDDKLVRLYEPHAPAPSKRLETLKAAKNAGLNIYVAMAPTFPECDKADIKETLTAVADLDPVTIFHEPINVRGGNLQRIRVEAEKQNIASKVETLSDPESWQSYALEQMAHVEEAAEELSLRQKIHFWPDQALVSKSALARHPDPTALAHWVQRCWSRISEWPGKE